MTSNQLQVLDYILNSPSYIQSPITTQHLSLLTMDDYSTNSESDYANSWITWFLSTKGNEYFVEIDDDYLMDRFNLTGLNGELIKDYSKALDMILDNLEGEESMDDEERETLDTSARFLYGLIHARFIVTSRGLAKMVSSHLIHEANREIKASRNGKQMHEIDLGGAQDVSFQLRMPSM